MAKPNYAFAKRQRELAKKHKKEEKLKRKTDTGGPDMPDDAEAQAPDVENRPPEDGQSPSS